MIASGAGTLLLLSSILTSLHVHCGIADSEYAALLIAKRTCGPCRYI